ncbi:MAG: DEAD/DEAH box helicase family protein, partial [Chloroflexi bacterium]|nr:DEAD/DEAH box helicase family protein [Chloroflexota bacterium]
MLTATGHFPAGLTTPLIAELAEAGYAVGIDDKRTRPEPHPSISAATVLLPLDTHQQAAVEDAHAATRGVVEHPTGSGKGRTIAATVVRLGVPTLVLVHRKVLLKQLVKELRETLNIPTLIGMIGAGVDDPRPITVATFQTLAHRLKNYPEPARAMLEKFDAVIVDEVHHVGGAKTYEAVMKALTNSYYRIGFSATAHRSDDETRMRVTGWLGPIQSKMTVTQAIETKRVVPADVYMIDPGEPHPNGLPWQEAYTQAVVRHESRNRICIELAVRLKGLSMILVERIEHGRTLNAMLHDIGGLNFQILDGAAP